MIVVVVVVAEGSSSSIRRAYIHGYLHSEPPLGSRPRSSHKQNSLHVRVCVLCVSREMVSTTSTWSTSTLLLVTVTCSFLLLFDNVRITEAKPRRICDYLCRGEDCYRQPTNCKWGYKSNLCGQYECIKGPGESCSDNTLYLGGTCEESLDCRCNKCSGCLQKPYSNIYECYEQEGVCKNGSTTEGPRGQQYYLG